MLHAYAWELISHEKYESGSAARAEAITARTPAYGFRLDSITTNAMVEAAADSTGISERIAATGAMLLQGTCWSIRDFVEVQRQFGWTRVVTNSAKLANIIKAHDYEPILRRTKACIDVAVCGNVR